MLRPKKLENDSCSIVNNVTHWRLCARNSICAIWLYSTWYLSEPGLQMHSVDLIVHKIKHHFSECFYWLHITITVCVCCSVAMFWFHYTDNLRDNPCFPHLGVHRDCSQRWRNHGLYRIESGSWLRLRLRCLVSDAWNFPWRRRQIRGCCIPECGLLGGATHGLHIHRRPHPQGNCTRCLTSLIMKKIYSIWTLLFIT
jgi:hypothetical protein